MRPLLFEIPLPTWAVPLGPALAALVVVALVIVGLSVRARAWDLVAIATIGALSASFSALRLQGGSLPIGPMPVYSFGALLSVAMFASWFLSQRFADRDGVSRSVVAGAFVTTAVCGLVGSRVLYVLTNLHDFHSVPDALAFRGGGLVFYGGALGGFVGAVTYLRRAKVPFLAFADLGAPCLALASCFGRIGCYLAGCDYGTPLSPSAPHFLARLGTFPRWPDEIAGPAAGSPAWLDQVLYRGLSVDSMESLPVHPAQLYESLGALVLFGALLGLRPRRTFRGQVFLAYVAGYGALRFLIEMLRDDPERGLYGPSGPPAIVWSLGCVALALAFAAGLSRSIAKRSIRAVTISATFLVALVVYGGLRTTTRGPTSLSTSQWIAILTSIAVAIACHVISTGSRAPGSGSKAGEGGESEGEDAGNANAEKPRSEAGFTGGTVSS